MATKEPPTDKTKTEKGPVQSVPGLIPTTR